MPKTKSGNRIHLADAWRHNGVQNETGNPTYDVRSDWNLIVRAWPVELLSASGGETLRGRQVTSITTHIAIGNFFGADKIRATDRLVIAGIWYAVITAVDPDGTRFEMRVECKREV
jgi:hypothetical protein